MEKIISKPQTRRNKRSLLLHPLSSPPSLNRVSPKMKSRSPRNHNSTAVTTAAATKMQNEAPSGDVNDTPTQDEPQSYTIAQIAEYLTRHTITQETCVPIFSAIALQRKKKMLFAPIDFQDNTLDALIDSGALVNCMSGADYRKIRQMSPKDICQKNGATSIQTSHRKWRH